ncbi:MAG TPA: ABC transporter ATP-binding protein [Tetragenococcus sp.]|nr:ABC transporter ATP-binding protein [Tetragenococcus sp.]
MSNTAIEFKGVAKSFGDVKVIPELDLKIQKGELFVLVGTSGSGKTTSLKMINRLEEPTTGDILIDERKAKDYSLQQLRWSMGYVLQQIALFPTMTVAQNIAVIPEMKKTDKKAIQRLVDQLLDKVGLDPVKYRNRMPSELSGGEQQRIGILRAIAAKPEIVLMDEPFGALDPLSRTTLQKLILELHEELHNTIIFVTHDMQEAIKLGDRIGIMSQGRLLQVGKPEEIAQNPVNEFVRDFFGSSMKKSIYQLSLAEVLQVQGSQIEQSLKTAVVEQDTSLQKAFEVLSQNEQIKVIDKSKKVLGYLTSRQIFLYLSRM